MSNYKKNPWIKLARSAKTPSEIKSVMESIEEAMKGNKNRTMTKEMNEALDILLGMNTTSSDFEVPAEWMASESEVSD